MSKYLPYDPQILQRCRNCMHNHGDYCESFQRRVDPESVMCLEDFGMKVEEKPKSDTQDAKADKGKIRPTLVPPEVIWAIAVIREYGNQKYGDPENWKDVEVERYFDSFIRHVLLFWKDPYGYDEESGFPHLWHILCNGAFLTYDMWDILVAGLDEEWREKLKDVRGGLR